MQLKESVYTTDLSANAEFIQVGEFEDATRTVVRALGKDYGVDVVFGGNNAGSNGKIITLPAQDTGKMMTRKQYAVAQGFANQEALHCLCTDVPFFENEKRRLANEEKPLTSAYVDIIEDLRIEQAGQKLYPGMPSQLGATADYTARRILDDHISKNPEIIDDLKTIGPIALGWRGRQRMGNSTPAIDEAMQKMSKENISQLDKWFDLVNKLETGAERPGVFDREKSKKATKKALELAYKFSEETMLPPESSDGRGEGGNKDKKEDKKGKEKGEKENGEAGDNGNSESQENGEASGGDENGGEGENESEDGKEEEKKSVAKMPGGHGASQQKEPIPLDPDTKGMLKELLREGDDKNKSNVTRPLTTCLDLVATRQSKSRHIQNVLNGGDGTRLYASINKKIAGKLAVMKRKFERALLISQQVDYVSGQRSGKLDVRRKGVQIMSGQENVYRSKTEGKDIDTAVTILVDASGSMGGTKMHLAATVCAALAECLNQTPVKLEILCFDTSLCSDAFPKDILDAYSAIYNGRGTNDFHRVDSITTWVVKDFKDTLRESRISIGNMWNFGFNSNADGDSILEAAKRLMKVRTKKRIMLVLSDGQPAYSCLFGDQFDHTKNCVEKVAKQGIHIVGIGIMSDAVAKYYPNHTVVRDINDLDKTVMDKLAKMILGDEFKIDNADLLGRVA